MCLTAISNIPCIAEQDIICYKIYILMDDKYVSPYQGYDMPGINELVTTELQEPGRFHIEKGFHSFAYLDGAEMGAEWFYRYGGCIVKCIIPKGSRYYSGKFGDDYSYCSESIQIEKIIKFY